MYTQPLNSHDLDFFLQILKEFNGLYEYKNHSIEDLLKNQFISTEVNIKTFADELGYSYGGSFRNRFFQSLKKLSQVSMFYQKKISPDGVCYSGTRFLINYSFKQTGSRNVKTVLHLNTFTAAILYKAAYNYAILNLRNRLLLKTSKSRLVHTYICFETKPGAKFPTTNPLNEFLVYESLPAPETRSKRENNG